METNLTFTNFKFRCSQLGHLMTNLEKVTEKQLEKIAELEARKEEAKTNPKRALTKIMQEELDGLIAKRDGDDVLPSGAKSYLDEVFRKEFWGRQRHVHNKYLEKGLYTEQDVLALKSAVIGGFCAKNDEELENLFIKGTPDSFDVDNLTLVTDTKSCYDMESFDGAELTTIYTWQLRGYSWLLRDRFNLPSFPYGELFYGLVNTPPHIIENERNNLFYRMGARPDDDEEWQAVKRQHEKNCIFDINLFKEHYPEYTFVNEILDFTIPEQFRITTFTVDVNETHIAQMIQRVLLARIYLCEKEVDIYKRNKA